MRVAALALLCATTTAGQAEEGPFPVRLNPRLALETARATKMVGVRVCDDHGVHVPRLQAGLCQPRLESLPGGVSWQTWIHDRRAIVVEQRVAVHMSEPRHLDRQFHSQHTTADFADL